MSDVWFSAMLRFIVLVEPVGGTDLSRSLIVFRAEDWPEAKTRALELGHLMGTNYVGGDGRRVRWCFESIETLDLLGDTITDGREVYSETVPLPDEGTVPFDSSFDPANSNPTQSGV